jgi:hypothetical protein
MADGLVRWWHEHTREGMPSAPHDEVHSAPSGGKIVTQAHRAVKVDVVELGAGSLVLDVHEYPHASRRRTSDVELASTDQRDIAKTDLAGSRRREQRVQVIRGGEQDRDQLILRDAVGREHARHELLNALAHRLRGVLIQGRSAPQPPERHGAPG